MKLGPEQNVNMPLKTVLSLITLVSVFTFSYFQITERLNNLLSDEASSWKANYNIIEENKDKLLLFLPNIKKCSKCNADLISGCFDNYTGELICVNCSTQSKISLDENSLSALQKLEGLHLDDLQTLSINIQGITNSIQFLDLFISFHLEGLKKLRSMTMLKQILNGGIIK